MQHKTQQEESIIVLQHNITCLQCNTYKFVMVKCCSMFNVCSVAKQIFNLGELLAIIFVQQ